MNDTRRRYFSIIPAAGKSQRMGQPKLLLPWKNRLLIDEVLDAWTKSNVDEVFVVLRKNDIALLEACRRWPVHLILPGTDPTDMKESIQLGLQEIERKFKPTIHDGCFVAPADIPSITPEIIDRLIKGRSDEATIVVPQFGDKQGHPVLLPWPVTKKIYQLDVDHGIDQLVSRHPRRKLNFPASERVRDIDTPEDYDLMINIQ